MTSLRPAPGPGAGTAGKDLGPGAPPAPDQVDFALAGRIRRTFVLLRRQARRQDPSDLTIAQLSALATIARQGPLGIGQLAEAEVLPSPAATRLADRLEEAGLVARHANPADRRGVLVGVTPHGWQLLAQREQAGNNWLASRLAALAPRDRRLLERALPVLESLVPDLAHSEEVKASERTGN